MTALVLSIQMCLPSARGAAPMRRSMNGSQPKADIDRRCARRSASIGLGQMGRGIAANLDRAGLLRAAFDIDPEAFGRAGLSAERRPTCRRRRSAKLCDTVLFVVPASPQIEACLSGPDGLLCRTRTTGRFWSTSRPPIPPTRSGLRRLAAEAGRAYVDCGMTGGAAGADAGTLTLMAGGDDEGGRARAPDPREDREPHLPCRAERRRAHA